MTEHEEERERLRLLNLRRVTTREHCYEIPSDRLAAAWKVIAERKR